MKIEKIQLIPNLVSLETNIPEIFSFSFYNNRKFKDFFEFNESSEIKIRCFLSKDVLDPSSKVDYQFSNISNVGNRWYYCNRKGPFLFKFNINEDTDTFLVNKTYQKVFIKVGWLQPLGYILTDYLVRKLEQGGKTYHDGAAARYKDKTYLFYGFGRNFKTTIISSLLDNGGQYIAEEFFLLDGEKVYATIPNLHHFDFRESHRKLLASDLSKKKSDCSRYDTVIFLLYSSQDKITELSVTEANEMVGLYHHSVNGYYYDFFKAKDFFSGKKEQQKEIFSGQHGQRFFRVEFTNYQKVINFIDTL